MDDKYLNYGFGRGFGTFPEAMNPADLRQFTNGAVSIDPAGDFKTGVRQAANRAKEAAKKGFEFIYDISKLNPQTLGRGWPFVMPPDTLKNELEKEEREKIQKMVVNRQ